MVASSTFIAAFVVAGQPSHQLLSVRCVRAVDIFDEAASLVAPKYRRHLVMVTDDDVTVLSFGPGESVGRRHLSMLPE